MSKLKGCGIIALAEFLDRHDDIWISALTVLSALFDNKIEARAYVDVGKGEFYNECLVLKDDHWQRHEFYETIGDEKCIVSSDVYENRKVESNITVLVGLKGAKGSSAPAPAYQPAPQPTAGQSAKEWADAMPQVYETEMKYAPLQAQSELDLLQKYAAPIGQAYKSAMESLYPETAGLQENLAAQANQGMNAEMPTWMKDAYKDQFNANLGTSAGSPIGADYMSRGMMMQQKQYNDYYRDLALSVSGRQPLAQPVQPQTGNYSQGFTPGNVMAMNQGTYGSYTGASANMYGSQLGYQSAVRGQNMSLWGDAMGMVAAGGGMYAGMR